MPGELAKHLPGSTAEEIAKLYGSITLARAEPQGSVIRDGVIAAYSATMEKMLIAATVICESQLYNPWDASRQNSKH